jgi:hypothetical protein
VTNIPTYGVGIEQSKPNTMLSLCIGYCIFFITYYVYFELVGVSIQNDKTGTLVPPNTPITTAAHIPQYIPWDGL